MVYVFVRLITGQNIKLFYAVTIHAFFPSYLKTKNMKRRLLYVLLFPLLLHSSCTMMVKGLAKSVAGNYDNQTAVNVADLNLKDENGNSAPFRQLFPEKTVYMYVWEHKELLPPGDENPAYVALKNRFAKYDDVVFINLYTGNTENDWQQIIKLKNNGVKAYRLSPDAVNNAFRALVNASTSPQIIGKDGRILGYKGPKPTDKLVIDYALFQARQGQNATASTKTLIKGINSERHFKDRHLEDWYENHFGKKAEGKLSVTISSADSNLSTDGDKE
jgi:hypothetical protein